MAAIIPALIQLAIGHLRGGRGGGVSARGGGSGGGREPKPKQTPEEYSMELLEKNARKSMINPEEADMPEDIKTGISALQGLLDAQNARRAAIRQPKQ